LSELEQIEEVSISASTSPAKESITERKSLVYETLIDPTTIRIEAEKNKSKLFRRFLFQLNQPEEIEFVSIEKHYEPYMVVSGKYLIDYYRACAYEVKVDRDVKEVNILNHTFVPEHSSNSTMSEHIICLEGEERLIKETKAFLILDKFGRDSKLKKLPPAPSEKNPNELIRSFKMQEIAPNLDVDIFRKRMEKRPNDIKRVVNEETEIDQRSVIYTPRFRLTYKCQKISKEAYLEFDGVTSKLIRQNENVFSAAIRNVTSKLKALM